MPVNVLLLCFPLLQVVPQRKELAENLYGIRILIGKKVVRREQVSNQISLAHLFPHAAVMER